MVDVYYRSLLLVEQHNNNEAFDARMNILCQYFEYLHMRTHIAPYRVSMTLLAVNSVVCLKLLPLN